MENGVLEDVFSLQMGYSSTSMIMGGRVLFQNTVVGKKSISTNHKTTTLGNVE